MTLSLKLAVLSMSVLTRTIPARTAARRARRPRTPALGPLQDNGGPTKTMPPGAGSPAVGKGTGCPQIDQRGNPRPSACTLGAVEAA